jgi:hypothetical protein
MRPALVLERRFFLSGDFSGGQRCAAAVFSLEKRKGKICRGRTLFCNPWFSMGDVAGAFLLLFQPATEGLAFATP